MSATAATAVEATARARLAFLRACELDVAVRKPGNVSDASPGHGMHSALFRASAQTAAGPLFEAGARVGARIEAAVAATLAVAGCNTNLGILLLCAPLAAAVERQPGANTAGRLRQALEEVLADLDLEDTRATYRAIAHAKPGGLGSAATEDVHAAPSLPLRAAMALAADRDRIALQYRDGHADLFGCGLAALGTHPARHTASAVQRLYLTLLSTIPDSHIVRKQGPQVAQSVMLAARPWLERLWQQGIGGPALDADAGFVAWDEALKATRTNPGTTADLTVATLMLHAVLDEPGAPPGPPRAA